MVKNYLLGLGLMLSCFLGWSQVENTGVILDWRQHNLTKYNKFLVNPTYSYVRDNARAISFWSRVQWTGVPNSPQTFLINYSGKLNEKSGAGLGLYQQNLGLIVDSGMLLNYAYAISFSQNTKLTFGMNSTLFKRGIDQAAINAASSDPVILATDNDFFLLLMPGINLTTGRFDVGMYAENLVDYNFGNSEMATDFGDKIYSAQLGYTQVFPYGSGIMQDARWRTLVYGKTLPNNDQQFGLNTMLDLPYSGWIHAGYNSTFGINGGLGVLLGEGISIGFTYESGSTQTNNALGSTFEAIATIDLSPRRMAKNRINRGGELSSSMSKEEYEKAKEEARERAQAIAEEREARKEEALRKRAEQQERRKAASRYQIAGATDKTVETKTVASAERPEKKPKEKPASKPEQKAPVNKVVVAAEEQKEPATAFTGAAVETTVAKTEPSESAQLLARTEPSNLLKPEEYDKFVKETEAMIDSLTAPKSDGTAVTREVFGQGSSYRTIKSALGVDPGFYLVVNVFSNKAYFEEFMQLMRNRNLEAQYFIHPDNKYYYVYLAKSDSYLKVKTLQRSHLNGQYKDDKWVLWVKQ